uniref:Uncharacterized protein n=1 Tax=Pelodiscus sinensis TaxID=13735 RepID=K7EZ94_PELSI
MSSLVFPSLSMKDHKAVTILHYPSVGSHVASTGMMAPSAAPPPSKQPPFALQTAPHLLASMQLQKLNSQYHALGISGHPAEAGSIQSWAFGAQPLGPGTTRPQAPCRGRY